MRLLERITTLSDIGAPGKLVRGASSCPLEESEWVDSSLSRSACTLFKSTWPAHSPPSPLVWPVLSLSNVDPWEPGTCILLGKAEKCGNVPAVRPNGGIKRQCARDFEDILPLRVS